MSFFKKRIVTCHDYDDKYSYLAWFEIAILVLIMLIVIVFEKILKVVGLAE